MTSLNKSMDNQEEVLINPSNKITAGLIAWFLPGFGHIYQGRTAKGILFAICIIPVLLTGIIMGSYRDSATKELQIGRVIYFSWKNGEKRLYFIPQAMIGAVAVPALIQAKIVETGREGFFHNIFAPPRTSGEESLQPTRDKIVEQTHSWFDLGTLFTAAAGLLNILAVFDAIGGPVRYESNEKKKKKEKNDLASEKE